MTNPNPHIVSARTALGDAWDSGTQGVAWQKVMLLLMQAQAEATLAVALELQVKNGAGGYVESGQES